MTRPEHQAGRLCRLLGSYGAVAIRLPAIAIKSLGTPFELRQRLGEHAHFDLVIFTSANAVRFGVALLHRGSRSTLAAIGRATARALNEAGYGVTAIPAEGSDSENLLFHPALAQLDGGRVLIVKGVGGRRFLQDQLASRGAQVVVAEVYARERARHSGEVIEQIAAQLAADEIQIITATSAEIAAGLIEMATPALRREFDRVHWLVPGERVADALRERGIGGAILRAETAEDQDLAAAILRWRSSTCIS